tara:strand:- start:5574 stop:7298 length:1725 start_codon:yes stop_codon:yes gene_type:complete
MNIGILVPIKPTSNLETYYSAHNAFKSKFTRVVFGLNENDIEGFRILSSEHVITTEKNDPFPLCHLWNRMAMYAFEELFVEAVVLLGDDIVIDNFSDLISDIQDKLKAGYKCINIREKVHPSWPTFPVATRELFPLPSCFVNQDADPYLYEYARRNGKAITTENIYIRNNTGGVEGGLMPFTAPRYNRQHIEWRYLLPVSSIITIDVIIPMSRININFLNNILQLPYDHTTTDVRVCVCMDMGINDINEWQKNKLRELELNNNRIRIRINECNKGASFTRTRLLNECHSEYCLFIDDDVNVDNNIIQEYVNAIKQNPEANGFVGLSRLPYDGRNWTNAIHTTCTFFWHISEWAYKYNKKVPWGVTANLMIKWKPGLYFDTDYPKTGGGEDIDLCIQIGQQLIPVPTAKITHPWRPTRFNMWKRMFEWAYGDGILNIKYPQFTFCTAPIFPELLLIYIIFDISSVWIPVLGEFIAQFMWIMFIHPLKYNEELSPVLEEMTFLQKIPIVIESVFARNASELGHTYGHIRRNRFDKLFTRFDWFLGQLPEGVVYEKQRSMWFLSITILIQSIFQFSK